MENIIEIKDLNGRDVAIGEKISVNGEVYECAEEINDCALCSFLEKNGECSINDNLCCSKHGRKDHKGIIFVKQEQMEADENKELDLAEILKDCPKGTKLYSPVLGKVEFMAIVEEDDNQIKIGKRGNGIPLRTYYFYPNGKYEEDGECMLYPSKTQRDWSKFKLPLKPPFEVKMEENDEYYYVDDLGEVQNVVNNEYSWRDSRYSIGNYFNTLEQAEYAAEKVKELLLSLRKEDR